MDRTASRAHWRSPPRSTRPKPSWRSPRSRRWNSPPPSPNAVDEQRNRQEAAEHALAALNESDAAISAVYEQLGRLGQEARLADADWRRQLGQREELENNRAQVVEELTALEARLHAAQEHQTADDSVPDDRQDIQAAADAARGVEVEARLAVRTAESGPTPFARARGTPCAAPPPPT